MKLPRYVLFGLVLSSSLVGCWGGYSGTSFNENGNPCDTYEHKHGIQVTHCDLQSQHSPFARH